MSTQPKTSGDCGTELSEGEQKYWKDSSDPCDTGTEIDPDYVSVETRSESAKDAYNPGALTEGGHVDRGECAAGERLDSESYASATENTDAQELDGDIMESAWAAQGVQRTTFYADGKDAYGNKLPETGADGEDLGARRKRLWAYNSGFYYGDRSDTGRVDREARETREMTEAVASQCGLTDRQQQTAMQTALGMDGRKFNWAGGRPAMALCAVAQTVADSAEEAKADRRLIRQSAETAFEHVADKSCTVDAERLIQFAFE